jgi:hypothetical protein
MPRFRIRSSLLKDVKSGSSYGNAAPIATQPRESPTQTQPAIGPESIRPNSLTADQMQGRYRRLWLPAQVWTPSAGTPVLVAQGTSLNYGAWALDSASTEAVVTMLVVPSDLDSSNLDPWNGFAVFTNLGAGAGNIRFELVTVLLTNPYSEQDMDSAGATLSSTQPAPAQNINRSWTMLSMAGISPVADNAVLLKFRRVGAHAADTLGNDCGFLGLWVHYPADM